MRKSLAMKYLGTPARVIAAAFALSFLAIAFLHGAQDAPATYADEGHIIFSSTPVNHSHGLLDLRLLYAAPDLRGI